MPVFSCFTGFGFLEFSGDPSECEKVYNALISSYRNPKTGEQTIDTTPGTHQEAKIYGWANAISAARVTLRRAANELRPETSYELLQSHEEKFGMTPGPDDSVVDRRAALAVKQKLTRGPRYEAIAEALTGIYGDLLVAYRPMKTVEAEAYPDVPEAPGSPGLFRRPDAIAKSVRLLTAVSRLAGPNVLVTEFSESNITAGASLPGVTVGNSAVAQSFTATGLPLAQITLPLKKLGSPQYTARVKIYAADDSGGMGNHVPAGPALATSDDFDVTVLTTGYVLYGFNFTGANQIILKKGTNYFAALEYVYGTNGVNEVIWGYQDGFGGGGYAGNGASYVSTTDTWSAVAARDYCFHVYGGYAMRVRYENWNRSQVESRIVKGDIMVVDGGNWGVAERIIVLEAEGDGDDRTFTAAFRKTHTANVHATTGPMPLWSNTKRHVLVVVKAAAAVDVDMVHKTNELFTRVMRAPTTWAIVQETTPGSGAVGPFAIGTTLGSPLGTTSIEEITL